MMLNHFIESFVEQFLSRDFLRRHLLARAPDGPLRNYLTTPFPAPETPGCAAPYLALDLETTGCDPEHDEIVSFGWVCMNGDRIDLASARHRIVQLRGAMSSESAVIHRISDDDCAGGGSLESVLGELLAALAGRVMIAHRAQTELGFIGRACERIYGSGILILAVDTLQIAIAAEQRKGQPLRRNGLRLHALREKYKLPRYRAHNALSDALATAELFLAQQAEAPDGTTLKSWLSRG